MKRYEIINCETGRCIGLETNFAAAANLCDTAAKNYNSVYSIYDNKKRARINQVWGEFQ